MEDKAIGNSGLSTQFSTTYFRSISVELLVIIVVAKMVKKYYGITVI